MKEQNARISINHQDQEWDKTFWNVPGWNPEKIRDAKVMVVGAGALGNEVIKNLTLLNVGHIVVVDFDVVEYSNLAKSVLFREEDRGTKKALAITKNLKKINSNVKTLSIIGDISTDVGLGIMRRMDVVIGCLDNRLARMFINRYCFRLGKTWVDGGIENLSGRYNVYAPDISCYECALDDNAKRNIRYRRGCFAIAKRNATVGSIPTTPIASSIIAGFQVQEALKIIFGNTEQSMAGQGFRFNGMHNFFLQYDEPNVQKADCYSHECHDEVIEAKELSHQNTIRELIDWCKNHFNTKHVKILLDEEIVLEVANSNDKLSSIAIYKNHLDDIEAFRKLNRNPDAPLFVTKSTSSIDSDFPHQDKTLAEMGIPFLHILKIRTDEDIHLVELSGDEQFLIFK